MSEERQYVVYDSLLTKLQKTPYWSCISEFLKQTSNFSPASLVNAGDKEIRTFMKEYTNALGKVLSHEFLSLRTSGPDSFGQETSVVIANLWRRLLDGTNRPWELYDPIPETIPALPLDRVLLSGYVAGLAVPVKLLGEFSKHGFTTFSQCAGSVGAVLLTRDPFLGNQKFKQVIVQDPERNAVEYRPLIKEDKP